MTCEVINLRRLNLLVGCPRDRERAAKAEVQYFIGDLMGDDRINISITEISGLIMCWTSLDPFEVVRRLRTYAEENPYQFRFAIKFTPIERSVPTDLAHIVAAAQEIGSKVLPDESFRVTVRRRHTQLDPMKIVKAVAEVFHSRVDLDNPDKTVLVEVLGEQTGVSILRPEEDILSIMTMRGEEY
ncbi:MAG: RNA-binding protein [Candidatus Thorarchaeota archaeon]|nr:RNA-binding protein [Candidatus Thorarchaeota archaeon]